MPFVIVEILSVAYYNLLDKLRFDGGVCLYEKTHVDSFADDISHVVVICIVRCFTQA